MSFQIKEKFKFQFNSIGNRKERDDNFAELADHLLIHILIYLPRKDICSFSIICKIVLLSKLFQQIFNLFFDEYIAFEKNGQHFCLFFIWIWQGCPIILIEYVLILP